VNSPTPWRWSRCWVQRIERFGSHHEDFVTICVAVAVAVDSEWVGSDRIFVDVE